MKDEKHLCRPATYASNGAQLGHDSLVFHVAPARGLDFLFGEMGGEVDDVIGLALGEARQRAVHVGKLQHGAWGGLFATPRRETLPCRLCRLDRTLMPDQG